MEKHHDDDAMQIVGDDNAGDATKRAGPSTKTVWGRLGDLCGGLLSVLGAAAPRPGYNDVLNTDVHEHVMRTLAQGDPGGAVNLAATSTQQAAMLGASSVRDCIRQRYAAAGMQSPYDPDVPGDDADVARALRVDAALCARMGIEASWHGIALAHALCAAEGLLSFMFNDHLGYANVAGRLLIDLLEPPPSTFLGRLVDFGRVKSPADCLARAQRHLAGRNPWEVASAWHDAFNPHPAIALRPAPNKRMAPFFAALTNPIHMGAATDRLESPEGWFVLRDRIVCPIPVGPSPLRFPTRSDDITWYMCEGLHILSAFLSVLYFDSATAQNAFEHSMANVVDCESLIAEPTDEADGEEVADCKSDMAKVSSPEAEGFLRRYIDHNARRHMAPLAKGASSARGAPLLPFSAF
jgi:hypothetical protein